CEEGVGGEKGLISLAAGPFKKKTGAGSLSEEPDRGREYGGGVARHGRARVCWSGRRLACCWSPVRGRSLLLFLFSSRRRHTRCGRDWSSDVCSSDLHRKARYPHSRFRLTSRTSESLGPPR